MKPKLDRVICVDLEATCWEKGKFPQDQQQEIIEIGLTILYRDKLEIETNDIFIKPTVSTISPYCTNLTGLSMENTKDRWICFSDAINILKNMGSRHIIWASCGDWDRRMLVNQCKERSIDYPFGYGHINIKTLFALKYKLNKGKGLLNMLKILNLEFIGTHHSGKDDAYNAAIILRNLLGWETII